MADHLYYYECPGCGHSKFSKVKGDFLCSKCDMFMDLSYTCEFHSNDVDMDQGIENVYARIDDLQSLIRWLMTLSIPPKYSKIARERCEKLHVNLIDCERR